MPPVIWVVLLSFAPSTIKILILLTVVSKAYLKSEFSVTLALKLNDLLGDINIGEPNALIGFAGPRVIEQTVGEKLPKGFQRSEFLQDHGAIDFILDRNDQKVRLAEIISSLMSNYNSERLSK